MAKKQSETELVSNQLRRIIDECGVSRYRISKETGISETALSLFCGGQRGLSMKALDKLGRFLELTITLGRKPPKKGK